MDKYGKEVLKFTDKMLEIFSRLLGLQPNYLKEEFGDPMLNIGLIFYPPCPQPKLVLGLGAHSDPNIMSVLLQDEIWWPPSEEGEQVGGSCSCTKCTCHQHRGSVAGMKILLL